MKYSKSRNFKPKKWSLLAIKVGWTFLWSRVGVQKIRKFRKLFVFYLFSMISLVLASKDIFKGIQRTFMLGLISDFVMKLSSKMGPKKRI